MLVTETELKVRYAETDQMGIAHHSNYPIWFEVGRTDYIRKLGKSYSDIEAEGILLPLIELRCRYKGAARYEDDITVKTSVKELTLTRVTFYYEVYRKDEQSPITTGETVHAWTSKELKPINIKKASPNIYGILNKSLE